MTDALGTEAVTSGCTDSSETGAFVATTACEGRRYAAAGSSVEHARGRLSDRLIDLFGERAAPLLDDGNSRVLAATLASCFYVEQCYNGERLTEENLDMGTEFADDLWPDDWRSDIRNILDR